MANYLKKAAKRAGKPTQKEPLDSRQVINEAGGYVYPVTDFVRLDRFLILGSEGGSYYATEHDLTKENMDATKRCIAEDGERVVRRVVEVSEAGRAPKNDPALFVLALCAAAKLANGTPDAKTRTAAFAALPKVARIGTHLHHFCAYVNQLRGFGPGLRRGLSRWYLDRNVENLQSQLVKYQSRDGWGHKDTLKLAHPKASSPISATNAAFRWVVGGIENLKAHTVKRAGGVTVEYPDLTEQFRSLELINAYERAKMLGNSISAKLPGNDDAERARLVASGVREHEKEIAGLVEKYQLTHEMLPTEFKNSQLVWEAIFQKMPMGAMIRNLANLTRAGVLAPMSDVSKEVVRRLHDQDALKKARIHPIQVLIAQKVYGAGHGMRSRGEGWTPVSQVVDALNDAFYLAFGNVTPTNKRWYIGLDVSGSMGWGQIAGVPNFTPREAGAAMCMVTARTEQNYVIRAFSDGSGGGSRWARSGTRMTPLNISPAQRLDDICQKTAGLPFGGTDCALPMIDALAHRLEVDAFAIYTDSETWAGEIHPNRALKEYRDKMGIPAKLIVVGMTSNNFTIADPNDAGQMDVVGFDTAAPELMSDFVRQEAAKVQGSAA